MLLNPFFITYSVHEGMFRLLESVLLDYIPFIVLLYGLFVVAGGIVVKGTLAGMPKINSLLIGTALASWIGTTGAAMLLIRPVIRANAWHKKKPQRYMVLNWELINFGKCSGQQVPYYHSWIIRRHIWCFCRLPVHSAQCREFPHPLGQFLRSCWKPFRLAPFLWGNTYIGNAPNFMVKSIAEENNIKMPSFFGYMGWSCAILIPTFLIDMILFFF